MVIPVKNFNFLKIEDNETKSQICAVWGQIKEESKLLQAMFNRHWKSIYNYLCVSENYLTDEKNLLKRKS